MAEVMKIMVTSFKRSWAATLSASDPAAGHRQPVPLPETLGYSWASLDQSLVGSLLPSPGSWCAQGSVCTSKSLFPLSSLSSGSSVVGSTVTSSKRAYAIPKGLLHPEPLPLQ